MPRSATNDTWPRPQDSDWRLDVSEGWCKPKRILFNCLMICWMSSFHSRVWIPNLGALPIIASDSLTHILFLFACFYEIVSCVNVFFSTCLSICVSCAAGFVFCSIFITWTTFFNFNMHLCHGACWCTHSLAHMPIFLFRLYLHFANSCVCVFQRLYTPTSVLTNICVCFQIYIQISTLI